MIDERELREELAALPVPAVTSADRLVGTVVRRGQAVRRRRASVAVVAAAMVVASAIGASALLPDETLVVPAAPVHTPAPAPSPTNSSEDEATMASLPLVWGSDETLPADVGDLGTFELIHEGGPGGEVSTAWSAREKPSDTCGSGTGLPALTSIEAGRSIAALGPDQAQAEGILLFPDAESARSVMDQHRAASLACAAAASSTEPASTDPRTVTSWYLRDVELGDEAHALSSDSALVDDVGSVQAGGNSVMIWARQGRVVVWAESAGSNAGDPMIDDVGGDVEFVRATLVAHLASADELFN